MQRGKKLVAAGLAALGLHLAASSGSFADVTRRIAGIEGDGNIFRTTISFETLAESTPAPSAAPIETPPPTTEPIETPAPSKPDIIPTTISGGLSIKNSTSYSLDPAALLAEGCPVRLSAEGAQILIIHTHSSEAYSPAGLDRYEPSGESRTQDSNYNVIRIGNELTDILTAHGLRVIHDTGVYDYPSYTGSYNRSGEAVEAYLRDNPSISIVIDLHRDALGDNDVIYKTVADESGVCASQVMLLAGSDDSGLEHPYWRDNLKLALYLQNAVITKYPSLMRPVQLVSYRYNQHLTHGSLILEVGSNGNTLQEALAAIRLFGETVAPALLELVE